MQTEATIPELLKEMQTDRGETLAALTFKQPVLLVFLRHFGCTFCREALAELSEMRSTIENQGTRLVFVHMADQETAERYFDRYDLQNVEHVSDPNCKYYAGFGLTKGNFNQLFGLRSWMRGFSVGVVQGHGIGSQMGDGFQMPGVFVLRDGLVMEQFIHKLSSDRPDYHKMARCCAVTED